MENQQIEIKETTSSPNLNPYPMRLYYFACILFALLLGMLNPLGLDPAIFAMIGTKSRMVNTWLIAVLISSVFLILSIIGYWILARKASKSSWVTVLVHLIPTLLFVQVLNKVRFTVAMTFQTPGNLDGPLWIELSFLLLPALYIIGQVIFVVQFFRLKHVPLGSDLQKN